MSLSLSLSHCWCHASTTFTDVVVFVTKSLLTPCIYYFVIVHILTSLSLSIYDMVNNFFSFTVTAVVIFYVITIHSYCHHCNHHCMPTSSSSHVRSTLNITNISLSAWRGSSGWQLQLIQRSSIYNICLEFGQNKEVFLLLRSSLYSKKYTLIVT